MAIRNGRMALPRRGVSCPCEQEIDGHYDGLELYLMNRFVVDAWDGLSDAEIAAKDELLACIFRDYGVKMAVTGCIADDLMAHAEDTALGFAYREMLSVPMNDSLIGEATREFVGRLMLTDFFYAPASTRFHLCADGGLSLHSLSVAYRCVGMVRDDAAARAELGEHWEAIAIVCGMFHDVCKVGYYVPADNAWNGARYAVDEMRKGNYEHGELSVSILRRQYGDLLPQRAYDAVDWHMGEYDHRCNPARWEQVAPGEQSSAIATRERLMMESAFVRILHEADMASTQAGL